MISSAHTSWPFTESCHRWTELWWAPAKKGNRSVKVATVGLNECLSLYPAASNHRASSQSKPIWYHSLKLSFIHASKMSVFWTVLPWACMTFSVVFAGSDQAWSSIGMDLSRNWTATGKGASCSKPLSQQTSSPYAIAQLDPEGPGREAGSNVTFLQYKLLATSALNFSWTLLLPSQPYLSTQTYQEFLFSFIPGRCE